MNKEIDKLFEDRQSFNENNDCLVFSLALALDIPYKDAHDICKDSGRKNGEGWYIRKVVHTAASYGYNMTSILYVDLVRKYNKLKFSAGWFAKTNPVGTFYVAKSGHCFVIKDGVIYNEGGTNKGRSFLTHIYKVEG
jgi:hypothetical protein